MWCDFKAKKVSGNLLSSDPLLDHRDTDGRESWDFEPCGSLLLSSSVSPAAAAAAVAAGFTARWALRGKKIEEDKEH